MMNERGKSDRPVVPAKSPNKAGQPAAEGMEGRGLTKEAAAAKRVPDTEPDGCAQCAGAGRSSSK
jgi:RNA-directed DNA polymerase